MIVYVLLGIFAVLLVLVLVVALRPAAFRYERSIDIGAAPDAVFAEVNDFQRWRAWSPWEGLDPDLKRSYSGPPTGRGAMYGWQSDNDKVGEGKMTIEESDEPKRISIKLEFIKPFAAVNTAAFDFTPNASGTRAVWTMTGENSFMLKAFTLFVNMDELIGKDFERGLAALKQVAETGKSSEGAVKVG
jgi:hypothetical protein